MNTRILAAVAGSTAVLAIGAITTVAIADDAMDVARAYVEPTGSDLDDGEYLGYIRLTGDDTEVAVDFVSHDAGGADNDEPELRVEAGALVGAAMFGVVGQPFRVDVKDGTIVGVQTADDLLDVRIPGADDIALAVTDAIARDAERFGDDGNPVDVSTWLDEHKTFADAMARDLAPFLDDEARTDLADWVAEHDDVSDDEWWDLEEQVLADVIDSLVGE